MAELKAGDTAPDIQLPDQNGKLVRLADYKGQKVLVYFYPKADTPGCTKQSCSIRDSKADLKKVGVAVIGISPDEPEAQKRFDQKYDLGFPLLSDPQHKTAAAYGAWGEKLSMGKKTMGIIRSSFLVDEQGRIARAWYKVSPEETVPKAREALASQCND